MFNCTLCSKTFGSVWRLDRHMVTHTKEKPYKCSLCPEAFGLKSSVKQHIANVHNGIKRNLSKNHHCTVCSYKCNDKSMLQVHLRKHSAELPFSCLRPGCGYRTKYQSCLSKHALQAHSDKRPFKCPSQGCSYKAKIKTHIKRHLRVHSNVKPFACTVSGCNYSCKCRSELKSHISRAHSNEKPFKCSVCDYRTKCSKDLRLHGLTHTKIKRFQCQAPNCGFACHQSCDLKGHFDRKHRKNKVICTEPRCNFRCSSIALLKLHLKRHELPIVKCPSDLCGFRTKYHHSLLLHISNLHKDFQSSVTMVGKRVPDLETDGSITLQCSFTDCNFQTTVRQNYDRHVITHKKKETGQYVCLFCCSRFSKYGLLNVHVQRHIREKPYSCSHCSYTTTAGADLKRHARTIHQIHVIPRGSDDQFRKCRTCGRNCFSYGESVLHSMRHLEPVVVLEQLKLHVL